MEREAYIAIGAGFILVAAGSAVASVMFDWLPDPQFTTIEPKELFVAEKILGRSWGHLDLSFETLDGGFVVVLLLDADQYRSFNKDGTYKSIYEHEGASGDYRGHVDFENYFIVFERPNLTHTTPAAVEQPIEVTYTLSITGVNPVLAVAAAVIGTAGSGFLVKGLLGALGGTSTGGRAKP